MKHLQKKIIATALMLAFCANYQAFSILLELPKSEGEEHSVESKDKNPSKYLDNPSFEEELKQDEEEHGFTDEELDEPAAASLKESSIQSLPKEHDSGELMFHSQADSGKLEVNKKPQFSPESLSLWQKIVRFFTQAFSFGKPNTTQISTQESLAAVAKNRKDALDSIANATESITKLETANFQPPILPVRLTQALETIKENANYLTRPDANENKAVEGFTRSFMELTNVSNEIRDASKIDASVAFNQELFNAQLHTAAALTSAIEALEAKWRSLDLTKKSNYMQELETFKQAFTDSRPVLATS